MKATKLKFVKLFNGGLELALHVQPGARKSEFAGLYGDRLKVRLQAPPVDGKANEELLRFIKSELKGLGVEKIELTRGDRSREKKLILLCSRTDLLLDYFSKKGFFAKSEKGWV